MSETPVDELEGRELDAAVAAALVDADIVDIPAALAPPYSLNKMWVASLEEDIEARGLVDEYVHALFEALCPGYVIVDELDYDDLFRFITATPTERCRAALTALRGPRWPI